MSLHVATGQVTQPTIPIEKTTKQVSLDDKIINLAKEYGINRSSELVIVKRIMGCETLGDPNAIPDPTKYRLNKRKDGTVWSTDLGYFQINDFYWASFFKKMGLDIHKPDDNLRAGFWILAHQGTKPWVWSKHCWQLKT